MTTIERHGPHATLINVFTVEPENAARLAGLLDEATETVMRHVPGFVSANIHVSTDGTQGRQLRAVGDRGGLSGDAGRPDRTRTHGACRGAGVKLRPARVHGGVGARS